MTQKRQILSKNRKKKRRDDGPGKAWMKGFRNEKQPPGV